ncbi:MAG: acetolactate synthase small subunit [Acutalibacteraceae bacterium]
MIRENETMRNYIISVMVNNHFGVLTRISGLFARRGYNIKSLTVGETQDERISRMTIEFYGDEHTNEQIQNQLRKVVDVVSVTELRRDSSVCRELYLLKVRATDKTRAALVQIADIFRAKTVDVASDSLIFEIAGDEESAGVLFQYEKYGVLRSRAPASRRWRAAGSTATREREAVRRPARFGGRAAGFPSRPRFIVGKLCPQCCRTWI